LQFRASRRLRHAAYYSPVAALRTQLNSAPLIHSVIDTSSTYSVNVHFAVSTSVISAIASAAASEPRCLQDLGCHGNVRIRRRSTRQQQRQTQPMIRSPGWSAVEHCCPRRRQWRSYGFYRLLYVCLSVFPHDI